MRSVFGRQAGLRPQLPRPPRRAVGHLEGRNGVEDPRSGLTHRSTGWFVIRGWGRIMGYTGCTHDDVWLIATWSASTPKAEM